jgi:hypothetical protein
LVVASVISSCELYNPAEQIPAYIHIDKFTLTTTSAEGSASHKITDAWVYVDEQLIGCFELPATFPVLWEGTHTVMVRPGIKINGISASRSPYPFFNKYEQSVDFQAGKVITLSPATTYLSSTQFALNEDFEMPGVRIDRTTNSDTSLQLIASPDPNVFEGAKSSVAYLDGTRTFFECSTVTPVVLPKLGSPVFLEFNYKCNYQFTVSVLALGTATSEQFAVLNFNPSETWNKTYLYLTPQVSGASAAVNYKIVWGIVNNIGQDSVAFFMDNVKVVHF